jgi:hypothetical protein
MFTASYVCPRAARASAAGAPWFYQASKSMLDVPPEWNNETI